MEKLDYVSRRIVNILNYVSCFLLLGVMVFIVVYIVLRGVFGFTIFGSYEIVQYVCLLVVCCALGGNDYHEGNVKVTVLTDALPKKIRAIPEVFALLLCCVSSVSISCFMYVYITKKLAVNSLTLNLQIPIWIFALILFISFIILSFSVIIRTIKYFVGYSPERK